MENEQTAALKNAYKNAMSESRLYDEASSALNAALESSLRGQVCGENTSKQRKGSITVYSSESLNLRTS